jgi:adenine-specific DNA-methyltransferase
MKAKFRNNQDQIDQFIKSDVFFITKNYGLRRDLLPEELEKRKSITDLLLDWGDNQDSDSELTEIFPEGKPFGYPKPTKLIYNLLTSVYSENSIILDSFAGSGTSAHAVLKLNKEDGGKRKFILVEMDEKICKEVTSERMRRVIDGYEIKKSNGEVEKVEGLGSGFRYCRLGETLFDEFGNIKTDVTFRDLAHHIFFSETGAALGTMDSRFRGNDKQNKNSPLIGVYKGVAYYLLFNGVMGDKSAEGGNILTNKILEKLPKYNGDKIIFGEGCR